MYSVEAFSRNLKRIREEKGYNRRQLARKAGVYESLIYRYENGISYKKKPLCSPSVTIMFYLAEALGVSLDELCRD